MNLRLGFLGLLVFCGTMLLVFVIFEGTQTPLGRTFSPLFSFFGRSTKTMDRLLSRVVPVDQIDEKMLGNALKAQMHRQYPNQPTQREYVQELVNNMAKTLNTSYEYEIFVVPGPANAAALPGGTLLITTGMLRILESEAQLVAVLGHEMGHVERGHCFDAVRFELLGKKMGGKTLGEIADTLFGMVVRLHFSKTQEIESDQFGFELLTRMLYYPLGMSEAFGHLQHAHGGRPSDRDPFRDYIESHPPVALRIENYREVGQRWLASHPGKYYVGKKNFLEGKTRTQISFDDELK